MTNEKSSRQIADFIHQGEAHGGMLDAQARAARDPDFGRELADAQNMWRALEEWPDEAPSQESKKRFLAMLETYEQCSMESPARLRRPARRGGLPFGRLLQRVALAAALLALGFWLGGRGPQRPDEAQALLRDMDLMAQDVSLALMRHQSPSERLTGVNWAYRIAEPAPRIVQALLHTARFDPNINVRLSAIEALTAYRDMPEARQGLIESLGYQSSPMAQIALIDALVGLEEKRAAGKLEALLANELVNPAVRKRAEKGLSELQ